MNNQEQWAERIREWRASGLTSERYSEGKGFTADALRHWAQRLGMSTPRRRQAKEAAPPSSGFVMARVVRADAGPPAASLVVECGGARISVTRGFDAETFSAVVGVLLARGGAR